MSLTDPKDKRTWSGTTSNMYEALKRNGLEVDTLHAEKLVYTLLYPSNNVLLESDKEARGSQL